jgi:hypothetical protein
VKILKIEAISVGAALTPDGKMAVLSVLTAAREKLTVMMTPELLERLQWRISNALSGMQADVEED